MSDNKVKVVIAGVDEFSQTFSKFEHVLGGAKENLIHFSEAAGLAFAGEFILKTAESIDQMGKLGQKTGLGSAAMSQFAFAAKLTDVPLESFAKNMERLSKVMVGFDDSTQAKSARVAFERLGISVRTSSGELRSSEEVLLEVADKFSKMKDGAEKTGTAMQIFGKSGAEMIPLLNEGRDGIEEMRKEAEDLGLTISESASKQAEQFNDNLKRLTSVSEGLALHFVEGLLPAVTGVSNALAKGSGQMSGAAEVGKGLGTVIQWTASAFFAAAYALDFYILKIEKHQNTIKAMIDAIGNPLAAGAIGGAMAADAAAASDLDAQFVEMTQHFNKMFAALDDGAGKARKSLGGVGGDLNDISEAVDAPISKIERLFQQISLLGDVTLAALKKVEADRGEITTLDKDLAMLASRLQALQEFLSSHPGEFFPEVAKQAERREEGDRGPRKGKREARDSAEDRQMPGGMTPQDIPINVPNGPLEKQAENMKKIHDLWQQLGADIGDQVKQAALYGRSWGDVLKALIIDIGMAIIKFELLKHAEDDASDSNGSSGGGGFGGGIFGAILGGIFGKHASGGGVMAGMPYLVGENGPELFTSPSSGSIVPNYMLGSGGAGVLRSTWW
jgi:hypothetical protein